MGRHYDLAIVGGGIVGLGHAVAALRRGLTVAVVDRASTVEGASVRNFGHLSITAQEGEARAYADLGRELWLTLAVEAGFWLRESGTVVVAQAPDELAVLEEFRDARGPQDVRLLTPGQVRERIPVADGVATGGAFLPADLQVDPREAAPAIARWLDAHGVDFFWHTTVTGVETGRVHTSRGRVSADAVVVAVDHEVDRLFPGIAEAHGIQRCGLDMMLVEADLERPLAAPVLTGWSLIRAAGFAGAPSADAVRDRLAAERPDLAAHDVDQVFAPRPDGSLIVGAARRLGDDVPPFQSELAFDLLLGSVRALFGLDRVRVVERWQGIHASAPDDFLVSSPAPSVRVVSVTSGVGMTSGLGLADRVVDELFATAPGVLTAAGAARSH
ncbi:TIGR03364 family FAD-dependent oxidoreductase [Leifsonia shinshuensis]|uniref:FAD dependent oxidoreductase TIGR03364 n=1 Tax=Leifsonia shinshuensis TaxID=150026 RepID=A0A853CUF5_9MICO|nr:TIGR03364 family FAD-dependent oxidoreductase [Leifsonia shinshuensis]NYJ22440.1 FAD dependent oxidoreductase TIGR03364 [Leifsonia shinshuensis]